MSRNLDRQKSRAGTKDTCASCGESLPAGCFFEIPPNPGSKDRNVNLCIVCAGIFIGSVRRGVEEKAFQVLVECARETRRVVNAHDKLQGGSQWPQNLN